MELLWDVFRLLDPSVSAFLYSLLSCGAVAVGMAIGDDDGTEPDEGDEDLDEGIEDDDDAGEAEEPEPVADDQPFYKLNDRQVYKTREDFERAFVEAQRTLESYRKHGSPDDLATLRAKAEIADKFQQSLGGGEKKKAENDYLAHVEDPERRKVWEGSLAVMDPALRAKGFVTKDDLQSFMDEERQRMIAEYDDVQQRRKAADLMKDRLESNGHTMTPGHLRALHTFAQSLTEEDPSLLEKWNRGDVEGYIDGVYTAFYGKPPAAKQSAGASVPRDGNGRFTREQYAAAKNRRLPKVGSSSGSGESNGSSKPKGMSKEDAFNRIDAILDGHA